VRIDRLKIFLDSMGGGAWPFLVGGVICLVNSVNERDLDLLNSLANSSGFVQHFLEGLSVCSRWKFEAITGL
jgi:Na+/citrate or Na+/malate symporter